MIRQLGATLMAISLLAVMGAIAHSRAHANAEPAKPPAPVASTSLTPPAVEHYPDREALFGETHQHTSWSLDAYLFGNTITGPADSYKYYKGEAIKHPLGYDIKIETPLDWAGVTDHSEYVGVTKQANTPGSAVSKLPAAQGLILHEPKTPQEIQKVFMNLVTIISGPPVKELMSPEVAGTVWKENVKIADDANEPGKFTAFCAYEYTSQHDFRNLHRNIFFRDCAKVPEMPYTSLESWHPEDLWKWMDTQRKAGNELLAISHNANLSDGWMYPTDVDSMGRPIDAAYAASRDRNERLVEIKQIKGQSETHPALSPNDEFSNYEITSFLIGLPADSGRMDHIVGSYARQALKDGIAMQDTRGFNPYKFGIVGGSDSHNTGTPYRQDNFYGGHGINDGAIETRMAGHLFSGLDVRLENPAGVTGVWAEENTRASIWDAMYRRETFGTSGPHIKIRFFGGWEYKAEELNDKEWVKTGYKNGVPMGSDLKKERGKAPTFIVWAVKDPTSGNLDRIQIIKGWTKSGQSFEKIYDVVWSGDRKVNPATSRVPAIQSTVDIGNATYTNTVGSTELKTVWTDPDFDPSLHAFYYARALEIPTPRWSTIQAHKVGIAPPDVVPATVQERAWSSPIWYTPTEDDRKKAAPGTTVADLKTKGAVALTNDQLKTLIVGKSIWVRNTVTGEPFKLRYGADGQSIILHIGRSMTLPSEVGDPVRSSYLGVPTPYSIQDGKLITDVAGTPFTVTIYKLGDTYYGARSNEFGYADYQILPKGPANLVDLKKGELQEEDKNVPPGPGVPDKQ
jgi:hypothetical protein